MDGRPDADRESEDKAQEHGASVKPEDLRPMGLGHTGGLDLGGDPQNHARDVTGQRALTPEQQQARSRRSLAIGLGLAAFVLLVFLITLARLQANTGAAG